MSFKQFLNESFEVDIGDIKPTASALHLAKKIKKKLDKGEDFDAVFSELTSGIVKTQRLRIHVITALKKMGVDISYPFD